MEFLTNFFLSFLCITLIFGISVKTLNYPSKGTIGKNIETISQDGNMIFNYPKVHRDDVVDNYHETKISDPYRWLENPNSDETKNFIAAQNLITDSYLKLNSSLKESIHRRLEELDENYSRISCPERHGNKYYFYKSEEDKEQQVLYVQDTLDSEPKVFFDPNISSPNASVATYIMGFSDDGTKFAYLSENGAIWVTIQFLNAETGEKYPEVLEQVRYTSGVAWTHDSLGAFYSRYPQHNTTEENIDLLENMKIYYHRVGTPQSEDILVVEFPEQPLWRVYAVVSDCGQFLLVFTTSSVYFTKLNEKINGKFNLTQIVDKQEELYVYIGNDGTKAIFMIRNNTSNGKIIAIDLLNHQEENWTILVPEEHDKYIYEVTIVDNDKFIIQYHHDMNYLLQLHCLKTGKLIKKLSLGIGAILDKTSGNRKHPEYFFRFTSFTIPGIIYKLNVNNFESPEIYHEKKLINYDSKVYEMIRVFYPSKDNTKIPMTIVMRKGAKLDGSMPALLHGYDGFYISTSPAFTLENVIFTQHFNGIAAITHVRGGTDFDDKWHEDGILMKKQNAFDDFQSAAEYLIKNGYTSSEKLAIKGVGIRNLLTAVSINQRPELFGAAVINDGIFDMLRLQKLKPISSWISEYGNYDDSKDFENIIKYSPIHNVKLPTNGGQYPATLILADSEEKSTRSLHALKFIATLQNKIGQLKQQKNPLMARINIPIDESKSFNSKYIQDWTVALTFIAKSLNFEFHF